MISKKAEYAINILTELAKQQDPQDKYHSSKKIAEIGEIPPNLVHQLVSTMQKEGLVHSARGPKGGISLAQAPEQISLKQVVEIFDGKIGITRCLLDKNYCHKTDNCPLHQIWSNMQGKMISELEKTNIKELARAYERADNNTGEKVPEAKK